jgi:hypothetical protein
LLLVGVEVVDEMEQEQVEVVEQEDIGQHRDILLPHKDIQ